MRGGKREGAGRKRGSPNRYKLQLEVAAKTAGGKLSAADRMRVLKRQVALCVADGMPAEKIAAVMGLPIEKLRAVFAHELEHGREIVRADELLRLDAASEGGKVAASKIILANAGKATAPGETPKPNETDGGKVTRLALRVLNGGLK